MNDTEPCRLGLIEYDNSRYCFAHGEFADSYGDCPGARATKADR